MNLNNKNILVLGLGITGIATIKALNELGAKIFVSDLKSRGELKDQLAQIKDLSVELFLGNNDLPLDGMDLIIKSPGIPLTVDIIKKAKESGIEVITDLELAYRLYPNSNLIAITGTNGKTTTATLVGRFFNKAKYNTHVIGNIGIGLLWEFINSRDADIFVVEASSFQLESTYRFKPKVSTILNISPDHLNWHKTYDDYIKAKKKICINQTEDNFTILNYDDKLLRNMKNIIKSNIIWFSVDNKLSRGIYIKDRYIVINDGSRIEKVIRTDEIKLLGKHNLENVLASIGMAWIMGINTAIIREELTSFMGVEHRIEYVTSIKGIKFYNDSKGTNSEASIKAIEAMEAPIVLIAGGYDKGNTYDEFIKASKDKTKAIVLLGETKEKIYNTAIKYGVKKIYIVNTMDEAVKKSFQLAEGGDSVLLSPACASWDMYSSFEKRGRDFKKNVYSLGEE